MILTPRTLPITLTATLAALVVPASAAAEYLVPEGNSAVSQYTEGFPTAGGERKTEGNKPVTAAKALGAANARKLADHGPDGAAVAQIAAETAPPEATPVGSAGDGAGQSDRPAGDGGRREPAKVRPGQGGSGPKQDEEASVAAAAGNGGDGPGGSSGLGEILGTATGSSSGNLGPLLPLAILAAIAWGFAFLWRQRQHHDPAAGSKT
jgi:hypothetical protein